MTIVFSAEEGSEYVFEPLREAADFTLYRGSERRNAMPILALVAEQPSPQKLARLEHEFSLADELHAAWAAQPLTLTQREGRAFLILKDPGGEPLDRLIERHKTEPIDLARILPVAIGLAAALGQVHRQGIIHKDAKPANALVDDTGHAWLTGFGVASRLPRERQVPAPPEVVAGTLAYMSPEQTGRMNRSIDTRSDLYSLGVTLYQMLTGVLPFTATDPLEWVHCHIARQPEAPADRSAVPKQLSAVIMKLLAKNAEDRYQTAAGLEADLRRRPRTGRAALPGARSGNRRLRPSSQRAQLFRPLGSARQGEAARRTLSAPAAGADIGPFVSDEPTRATARRRGCREGLAGTLERDRLSHR
jgi:serine/threonine protein kinase